MYGSPKEGSGVLRRKHRGRLAHPAPEEPLKVSAEPHLLIAQHILSINMIPLPEENVKQAAGLLPAQKRPAFTPLEALSSTSCAPRTTAQGGL
mgnify:CR=1 FL=1